jgi:hypothetical protein
MPPKVPALPREAIERALYATGVPAHDIRAMLRCDAWRTLESRNEQVVFFHDFVKTECGITLPADVLGRAFGIEASHVRKLRSKAGKTPKPPYRPPALDQDQIAAVVAFIESGHRTHNYVTQRDVLRFIETNHQKCLTYPWMSNFLRVHGDLICQSIIRPRENVRLEVPQEYLDHYIKLMKDYVPLVPTELLFNIDESGFSDWEERKPKRILLPTEARTTTLHYPASRKIRHQTLVCCVTAAGDAYCPLLISAQATARDVFRHQIRDRIDLQIEIAPSPYVTSEIFQRYIETVLIPAVEANRELPGCANKPAILFCDNCSAHMSDSVLQNLARHGVLVLTYPPHTSHIFQVLDVLLFGLIKRSKKYQMRDDGLSECVDHILRLFRGYEAAMGSTTIRAAWTQAGFEYENRNLTTYLNINEQKIRDSPDFREIWNFDYHEPQLSARRQSQRWGWINEHMFRKREQTMLNAEEINGPFLNVKLLASSRHVLRRQILRGGRSHGRSASRVDSYAFHGMGASSDERTRGTNHVSYVEKG